MTTAQLATRRNAALARSVDDLDRVEQFTSTDYMVESATERGRYYLVVVQGGTYSCNCESGRRGAPCWHAGAVYRLRTGLGKMRVVVRG